MGGDKRWDSDDKSLPRVGHWAGGVPLFVH